MLVENVWRPRESWSYIHLLCRGMVGFGQRRNLGTTGKYRVSFFSGPALKSSKYGTGPTQLSASRRGQAWAGRENTQII